MLKKILTGIDTGLTFFEDWTLFLTVIGSLLALFANIVLRYAFNYSLAWSEEFVKEVIMYTTFIGCSAAIKQRSTIKIDALVQLLPQLKRPLTYVSHLAILIFSGMMIYYGWLMAAMQAQTHQKTIILKIPLVYLYAMLPLMGVLMCLRTMLVLYQETQERHTHA